MKRSDMISKIEDVLLQSASDFDLQLISYWGLADDILHTIESEMLPPAYDNTSTGINDNYTIYGWEPEDSD